MAVHQVKSTIFAHIFIEYGSFNNVKIIYIRHTPLERLTSVCVFRGKKKQCQRVAKVYNRGCVFFLYVLSATFFIVIDLSNTELYCNFSLSITMTKILHLCIFIKFTLPILKKSQMPALRVS